MTVQYYNKWHDKDTCIIEVHTVLLDETWTIYSTHHINNNGLFVPQCIAVKGYARSLIRTQCVKHNPNTK